MKMAEVCGWFWPFESVVIITPKPTLLKQDEEHRLHASGGPALSYPDGFSIYAHHGTRIPEEWGKLPAKEWKAAWLLETDNQEQRRVLIEELGYSRIMHELNSKTVHKSGDMELARIENVDVEPLHLLKVKCPSTGVFYALRVPPAIKDCETARQWTFGQETEQLIFAQET
jgi:hypothetical protein